MFSNNYVILSDNIYLYKNFLSIEEYTKMHEYCISLPEEQWKFQTKHDWFKDKVSYPTNKLLFLYDRLTDLVSPDYTLLPSLNLRRLRTGEEMYLHSDNLTDTNKSNYKKEDHTIEYGIVVYFNNNYEGGEIYYPQKELTYRPNAGDLVIHGAQKDCEHKVNQVISGTRYSYSNFIFPTNSPGILKSVLYKEFKELSNIKREY